MFKVIFKGPLRYLNCSEQFKLGDVYGSSYTILIEEVKEVGNQGYEFLLRDEIKIKYNLIDEGKINKNKYSDIFII